jgi:hypothetical protein
MEIFYNIKAYATVLCRAAQVRILTYNHFIFIFGGEREADAMGGEARSAPFCVLKGP